MFVPSSTQGDGDLDGFGKICDAGFDNDGGVGTTDLPRFKNDFGGNCQPGVQTYSGLGCVGTSPCPVRPTAVRREGCLEADRRLIECCWPLYCQEPPALTEPRPFSALAREPCPRRRGWDLRPIARTPDRG